MLHLQFLTGKTVVKVTVQGGGGTGGRGGISTGIVNGGGGGGMAVKYLTGLTPGNTLTVTVGAGGTAISAGSSVICRKFRRHFIRCFRNTKYNYSFCNRWSGSYPRKLSRERLCYSWCWRYRTNGDYNISGAKGYLESSIGWVRVATL
jgi:hypothetical protein